MQQRFTCGVNFLRQKFLSSDNFEIAGPTEMKQITIMQKYFLTVVVVVM